MTLLEFTIEIKVAIITAIIAGFALLISIWSGAIAKKALRLSEKQYNNKLPDFELYFNQGFRFHVKDKQSLKRLLLFQLTVMNKSELRNTFRAQLEIEYLRDDDSFAKVILDHKPELATLIKKNDFSIFASDIEIEAKSTNTKWLLFEQPNYLKKIHRIEKYAMRIIDVSGNQKISEAVLIQDLEE